MKSYNVLLRELIDEERLSYKAVMDILKVSRATIRSWLSPAGSKNYRKMREIYYNTLIRSVQLTAYTTENKIPTNITTSKF